MKAIVFILIISSFLQTTVIPLNLVLIILISRSFLKPATANLFLAFSFGLLVAHLSLNNLGVQSLTFLLIIQIAQVISKTRFAIHSLLIVPLIFILLSANALVLSLLNHQSAQIFPGILIESIVSLPVFYLIRFWDSRFVVQKNIKLKFR